MALVLFDTYWLLCNGPARSFGEGLRRTKGILTSHPVQGLESNRVITHRVDDLF